MKSQGTILDQIRDNYQDPHWLEENAQEIYELLREQIRDTNNLDQIVEYMLLLMPKMLNREDLKRWGRLLEQAYQKTPLADANGLDGDKTVNFAHDFIMQKRPKVPQLPTKTQRRKRVILHPTQMFEIYLILLMAYYYETSIDMPPELIDNAMRFARTVNDPYCNNKLHQALAFIYNKKHENSEQALAHAQTSYAYWQRHSNVQEAGLSAYAMGIAYRNMRDFGHAERWLSTAAEQIAQTPYRRQHLNISQALARLKMVEKKTHEAYQWANIAIDEAEELNLSRHVAIGLHYRSMVSAYVSNLGDAENDVSEAMRLLAEEGDTDEYMHCEYTLAYIEYRKSQSNSARERLETLADKLSTLTDSRARHLQKRVDELLEAVRNGADVSEVFPGID